MRERQVLVTAAILFSLCGVSQAQGPGGFPVTVTNQDDQAVPVRFPQQPTINVVQGTNPWLVAFSATGNVVRAQQDGLWTVRFDPTANAVSFAPGSSVGINGTVTVAGAVGIASNANTVQIDPNTTVNVTGNVGVTGPVTVTGDVGVTGTVGIASTANTIKIDPSTTVAVTGNVGVTGPVSVTGNVGVSGNVGISSIAAGSKIGIDPDSNSVNVSGGTLNIGNTVGVQGTISVGNTSANPVPVQVQNGTLSVTSSPASPLFVRDVDEPGRNGFQRHLVFTVPHGDRFARQTFQVPNGKILIIEHVSVLGQLGVDQKLSVGISATRDSFPVTEYVVSALEARESGRDIFVANHPFRLYTDPGGVVQIDAGRRVSFDGIAEIEVIIVGRLVSP